MDRAGLDYKPELVHCNDWHTGLVPALLSLEKQRPASVFTVHNLKHQGVFSRSTFKALGLPEQWWTPTAIEFYGGFSFMKAGLVFADRINTVSPTYAQEIQSARYGHGLEGVLSERAEHLWGILNGIDTQQWDPARSPNLPAHFDAYQLDGKAENKRKLQEELGLEQRSDTLLIAIAARLDEQKGIDVALQALQNNPQLDCQLAVMAHGSGPLVRELQAFADRNPGRVAVHLGFNESLSHRLFAGADSFLMPSRFEPCGLTQMFSMRYGTLPIAHRVGGLKDTVFDNASGHPRSNGFAIDELNADNLGRAIARAVECHRTEPVRWNRLQQNAMGWEFSWRRAAHRGAKLLEPFGVAEDSTLIELCEVLLSSRGEASGVALASRILARYKAQSDEEKQLFFEQLAEQFDPDLERVNAAVQRYSEERSSEALSELNAAVEPPRQELLRRINQSPGGTAALVSMRADLLPLLKANPTLKRIDNDFAHLLSSWFNRGFLQMQPVTWSSPADILEKIIDYEAVHEIPDWAELRRRLQPSDRRCYAFFHPAMPDEPLVFVEVALTTEAADNITELLSDGRDIIAAELANTAVFYSISNCQVGLRGVSFGNFLIKQVVADLLRDLPNLKTFVTLSPAPGFATWLNRQADSLPEAKELLELSAHLNRDTATAERKRHAQLSKQMAAVYYLKANEKTTVQKTPSPDFISATAPP
eukprot:maker-scaffold5312_size4760-snap-gene-0.2 protein:Tk11609 transcript:maker-scaffold5312_size4760-snap-gene-0.2-mRNA-1 annotation:"malonyl- decarboxylase mcd"